jgi:hypothetical protein
LFTPGTDGAQRLTAFTIVGLDRTLRIVFTINDLGLGRGVAVGAVIMLGTLFGLIVLIFGVVLYYDPEARHGASQERNR